MNKFLKVIEDVTNFIVGSESNVVTKEETQIAFTAPKKKRKYTRRKKKWF